MKVLTTYRASGAPVQNFEMFSRAWDECEELQVAERDVWIGRVLSQLKWLPSRYELCVLADQKVVGGIVLAHDPWDCHVGPCMSVFAQYVLPEYRNNGISRALMAEAIRIAKQSGYGVLAYTHRVGPWHYETKYRRLKNENAEN